MFLLHGFVRQQKIINETGRKYFIVVTKNIMSVNSGGFGNISSENVGSKT